MSLVDSTLPHDAAGFLYGIGVGPGSPEYLTLAAVDALKHCDVIAYHTKKPGSSSAWKVVADLVNDDVIREELVYPVTNQDLPHPDDYGKALADFYQEATNRLAAHLTAGRTVGVIALGDPMLHSSQQHLLRGLKNHAQGVKIIAGISSVSAAATLTCEPLAEDHQVATIIPATADQEKIVDLLRHTDTAVVMKLGRTFSKVKEAATQAGVLDRCMVVTRIGMDGEKVIPLADAQDSDAPYFSVVQMAAATSYDTVQGKANTQDVNRTHTDTTHNDHDHAQTVVAPGTVTVIGLGPGDPNWTTPETAAALAEAELIIGYDTYVKRVALRPGQRALPSDNMVEIERAVMALDRAKEGTKVVVVSSGDPGIFAMAAAVLEAADDDNYRDIAVHVLPGMTAAQAVASRVGAPLGHDCALISLSDRLKPLDVIEKRVRALCSADMAFSIYNPASKTRREQLAHIMDVIAEYREPSTPVIVATAVGSDKEKVTVTTVQDIDLNEVTMRTMLIVGASTTRTYEAAGTTRVFTPRWYPHPPQKSV